MKNKFTSNLGIKILSLFIAIGMWLFVTFEVDPDVDRSFADIPIEVINADTLTGSGKVFKAEADKVKVTVKGPNSLVGKVSREDIQVVADINSMGSTNSVTLEYSLKNNGDRLTISGNLKTVGFDIDEMITKSFTVEKNIVGEPADGYMVGDVKTDQTQVKVKGWKSVIDGIKTAEISLDVSDSTDNISVSEKVKCLDENGNEIVSDKITVSPDNIGVKANILKANEIKVVFESPKDAAPGYCPTGKVTQSLDVVKVKGEERILENLSEIVIPSERLEASDKKSSYSTVVNIAKYLPEGVSLVDQSEAQINVDVEIEAETVKYIAITADDIEVVNIPEGYVANIGLADEAMVELRGLSRELSPLNKTNISPRVDVQSFVNKQNINLSDIDSEFYNAPVSVTVPDNVKTDSTVMVTLHISKPAKSQE